MTARRNPAQRAARFEDLKWDQVDWNRGILRLPDSKTGKRDIVVSDAVIALLREIATAKNQPKRGRVSSAELLEGAPRRASQENWWNEERPPQVA